jgi:hypothetical protein
MYFSYLIHIDTTIAMSKVYRNDYSPPTGKVDAYHEDTIEDEYDHNFVFEVKALQSDRVELRPFIVSIKPDILAPRPYFMLILSPRYTRSYCYKAI